MAKYVRVMLQASRGLPNSKPTVPQNLNFHPALLRGGAKSFPSTPTAQLDAEEPPETYGSTPLQSSSPVLPSPTLTLVWQR
jgi:hypothetical protein